MASSSRSLASTGAVRGRGHGRGRGSSRGHMHTRNLTTQNTDTPVQTQTAASSPSSKSTKQPKPPLTHCESPTIINYDQRSCSLICSHLPAHRQHKSQSQMSRHARLMPTLCYLGPPRFSPRPRIKIHDHAPRNGSSDRGA